jgi:putative Holliday junction resolvase
MPAGYVLAFDFGLRHIGVAVGQTVTGTASPLTTLAARSGTPDWDAVVALVREWAPQALVVGLPLNMDDTESEMSGRARRFANRLGSASGIAVHLVDERLTSRAVKDAGPDRAHAAAAVLIAEGWLARLRP